LLRAGLAECDAGLVPRVLLAQHDVASLFVGEHEVAVEAVLAPDGEVRAEPLVAGTARDRVFPVEHAGAVLVEAQAAQDRVRRVLPRRRERHERELVVDDDVGCAAALRGGNRDPVRDRFEAVALDGVADRDDRRDRRAVDTRQHRGV
jgi:hypothetical protein